MKITKLPNGKSVKITSKGVFLMIMGKWEKWTCMNKSSFCYEYADNLYWKEAILCKKHYEENKPLMPANL